MISARVVLNHLIKGIAGNLHVFLCLAEAKRLPSLLRLLDFNRIHHVELLPRRVLEHLHLSVINRNGGRLRGEWRACA